MLVIKIYDSLGSIGRPFLKKVERYIIKISKAYIYIYIIACRVHHRVAEGRRRADSRKGRGEERSTGHARGNYYRQTRKKEKEGGGGAVEGGDVGRRGKRSSSLFSKDR